MPSKFIIEEVIKDLVDDGKSLVGPLMKLQYFAQRTNNEELLTFVKDELNGYKQRDYLPDYRKSRATISVDIQMGMEVHNDKEIPVEMLSDKHKETFREFLLLESVAVLEQMNSSKNDGKDLALALPLSMVNFFQGAAEKLYKGYYKPEVVGVRIYTNRNIIPRSLTSIRSRLLTFCTEIGKTFGYDIEIDSFNKAKTNNKKIVQIMNTTINTHGDGNVVNTGSNANIIANIKINKGDKEQLKKKLQELGIDPADTDEILGIVDKEVDTLETKKLGDRTIDWISKVSGKALKGIGNIAKEVSSSLLANLVCQYFGIPPM